MVGRAVATTVDELRDLALAAEDAAGFFPAMYVRVTEDIAARIDAGQFADCQRMSRLIDVFAGHYIGARTGRIAVPRCWQATWDVAGDDHLLIAQHLLLGANAHINHDLALAVVEVADDFGGLESLRGDFHAINDVLAASFVGVIRDLDHVSRWASEVAALGGGRLFRFSLKVARAEAWGAALRLAALDEPGRWAYTDELDRLVSVLAYLVTEPVFPLGLGVWLARRFELHDPPAVTRALLGPDRTGSARRCDPGPSRRSPVPAR